MSLVAVALASCQGDDGGDFLQTAAGGQSLTGNAAEKVTMNIQLQLAADGQTSPDEHATPYEYYVSKVDFYFFDATTRQLAQVATVHEPQRVEYTPGSEMYQKKYVVYQINDVMVMPGRYNIFAVANYDGVPADIKDQDSFLNLTDSETYKGGVMMSIPTEGAVMTSPAAAYTNIDLRRYKGRSYAMTIELVRVLSKIQLRQYTGDTSKFFTLCPAGKDPATDWYARITLTNYKYVNMNKCYYLFQHSDNMPAWAQRTNFVFPDNFLVKDTYADDEYVVDPYFYQKTTDGQQIGLFAERYYNWYGNFTLDNMNPMPASKNPAQETTKAYRYILENTAYKDCQKNGYSAGIVLQANVMPRSVRTWDAAEGKWNEEPAVTYKPTIYLYNYQFYSTIADVNRAGGLALDETHTWTDSELMAHGVKQCKATDKAEYETFYTYWIRENVTATPMSTMNYGIVRNHFYDLCIVGITGLGSSAVTPEVLRDNHPNSYVDISVDN